MKQDSVGGGAPYTPIPPATPPVGTVDNGDTGFFGDNTDMDFREVHINATKLNAQQKFKTNYIRTAKYTMFTFLPLGLLYQFYRFSNCYFLFFTILALFP